MTEATDFENDVAYAFIDSLYQRCDNTTAALVMVKDVPNETDVTARLRQGSNVIAIVYGLRYIADELADRYKVTRRDLRRHARTVNRGKTQKWSR